jgi:hypothetical protein
VRQRARLLSRAGADRTAGREEWSGPPARLGPRGWTARPGRDPVTTFYGTRTERSRRAGMPTPGASRDRPVLALSARAKNACTGLSLRTAAGRTVARANRFTRVILGRVCPTAANHTHTEMECHRYCVVAEEQLPPRSAWTSDAFTASARDGMPENRPDDAVIASPEVARTTRSPRTDRAQPHFASHGERRHRCASAALQPGSPTPSWRQFERTVKI